jgi:hypothetical protein
VSQAPNPDDEYQVVVTAAPPLPPRKPRAQNPAVDDMIQSGEITPVPRSLVVRSSSQLPPIREDERDDSTEPVARRPDMAGPKKRQARVAWLVAALAPALAALALQYSKPETPAAAVRTAEADSIAELVGTMFDGEARAAQVRADAIATSSMLRAAIQTDASTLQDMAQGKDIVFSIGHGESLEVFQDVQGQRTSLLRLPAGAPAISPPTPGSARIEAHGSAISVVVASMVTPAVGGGVGGVVALAAPIDLTRVQDRKLEHLTGVAVVGFGAPIPLGGAAAAPGGAPISVPITTSLAKGPALTIIATLAAPPAGNEHLIDELRYVCAGLATLFVIMFGVSLLVRR